MADDINKVMIVGRLTRDAELMYTNSGYALCKFSIAVNRRVKKNDQWIDEANYFDLNLWGKRGEALNQYLQKGTQVAIEAQLKQERWEKDGAKRSKVTLEAQNIQLLGGKNSQGGQYQNNQAQNNNSQGNRQNQGGAGSPQQSGPPPNAGNQNEQNYTPPSGQPKDYEDDIPFSCNYC
jgi:single-strand DNA-binding protein